jgi:hypothetical protein
MTLAFQSLLMMVLLVTVTVALLPGILRESRPKPSPPLLSASGHGGLWIVETPKGRWYSNGTLHSRADLEDLVRRHRSGGRIHYLPSDALPVERVTSSLRWLRSLAPGAVVLELPPPARP